MVRQRRKPGDNLKRVGKIQPGSRQRRHVQRLADMAGRIGPIRMLVEERTARGKIDQRRTSYQRQRAAHLASPENRSPQIHLSTLYRSTLDVRTSGLVANKTPQTVNGFLDPATILA